MTSDDAFMVLAGVRYCLGRHSYAPSLCCDWLKGRWPDLSEGDRAVILRDITSHIADEEQSTTRTWEVDAQTWKNFAAWAAAHPISPTTQNKEEKTDADR